MIDLFQKGGFMMYPILACSLISLWIIIDRLIYTSICASRNKTFFEKAKNVGSGPHAVEKIKIAVKDTPSPASAIVNAAIENMNEPEGLRNNALWRAGSIQRRDLERYLNALGVIAHLTPLMGLLGTVIGMIRAFMTIQTLGGQVDATDLAGGISEALLTTAAGLAVAIPALVFYHFLQNRIDNIEDSIMDSTVEFPEIMGNYNFSGNSNSGDSGNNT